VSVEVTEPWYRGTSPFLIWAWATVTTRDVPLAEVDEIRRVLTGDPMGYVTVVVSPAHVDGHMVATGRPCTWFTVAATTGATS
jgi:hypothetical protein